MNVVSNRANLQVSLHFLRKSRILGILLLLIELGLLADQVACIFLVLFEYVNK